ncbi:MAG: putative portal protein [Herbinix sp.]|jgi:A118 family predicted phage portal protein|nr:putative portal protein [Herbinix sp.]
MGIIKGAKSAFQNRSIPDYDDFYSNSIGLWKRIWQGNPPWRTVKRTGLNPGKERLMDSLGAAKVLCNELANLTFSEQVDITVSDKDYDEYVQKVLQANGFWKNFSDLLELNFAIGGSVIKTYLENGNIKLDYVDADMFIPTRWDNRAIYDGIFISKTTKGKKYYTLFEWQYTEIATNEDGTQYSRIVIENHLFESDKKDEVGVEVALSVLYPTLQPVIYIDNVSDSIFSYMRPSVANNIDTNSPLGVSVFANALDTLKALDVAFDSFNREFVLGRKRIIVPVSAIRAVPDPENPGHMVRYFDAEDEVYQAMRKDETEELKIADNTMTLRVEEHVSAINALLNILCFQTGLSPGTLSFDAAQGLKTATEVISQNSKTYRTKQSHQNLIKETLEDTVKSIIILGIAIGDLKSVKDYEVTIGFDDSIIIDENAIIDNNIKLVGAGLKSKLKAIMQIQKCDEETAKRELEQIAKEGQVTGDEADMFNMDNGNNNPEDDEGDGDK